MLPTPLIKDCPFGSGRSQRLELLGRLDRWKLCGVTKWILRKKCKDLTENVLYMIIDEVEKSNRAAAVAYHSAGVVTR